MERLTHQQEKLIAPVDRELDIEQVAAQQFLQLTSQSHNGSEVRRRLGVGSPEMKKRPRFAAAARGDQIRPPGTVVVIDDDVGASAVWIPRENHAGQSDIPQLGLNENLVGFVVVVE